MKKYFGFGVFLVMCSFSNVLAQPGRSGRTEGRARSSKIAEAGEGDYKKFWFSSKDNKDTFPIARRKTYVKVSVVSWYINKQSGFWVDRMASGTCQIKMAEETYSVALGNFALERKAYTAPVFDKVIVDNRLWKGGDLGISVFLKANQKNTVIAAVLSDMAQSSLGIASSAVESYGAVATASVSVPLADAGKSLISNVQELLKAGPKELPIFDLDSGLSFTTDLSGIKGEVNYVLLFRGDDFITQDKIKIVEEVGGVQVQTTEGKQLQNGAWMLLKIARNSSYGKSRPWEEDAYALRSDLQALMERYDASIITDVQALDALKVSSFEDRTINPAPSSTQTRTIGDRVLELSNTILRDGVLSEGERAAENAKNTSLWYSALEACRAKDPDIFSRAILAIKEGLSSGRAPENVIVKKAFDDSFLASAKVEKSKQIAEEPVVSSGEVWKESQQVEQSKQRQIDSNLQHKGLENRDPLQN